jgi:putative tricarboxylic transport membrane protein
MKKPDVPLIDKMLPAIFILIAVFVFISIGRLPYVETTDKVGPRIYPWLVSGLLVVLSGLLLTGRAPSHKHADITLQGVLRRFLPLLSICCLYCVALPYLGFMISTVTLLIASFYLLGERKHWLNVLIAVCCTVATYLLFSTALGIELMALPRGLS